MPRRDELWMVVPDTHFPLQDKPAMEVVHRAIRRLPLDGFFHLGDIAEAEAVSSWRFKKVKRPPLEYVIKEAEEELALVNAELDRLDESLDAADVKQRVVTLGNHDDWYRRFVTTHPYIPQLLPERAMRLRQRGWKWHPFGARKIPTVGRSKLRAYHGNHFGTQYHAKQHVLKMGCSVVYGHWHDVQMHSVQTYGGHHTAWSLGCLRDMDADFLQGRPTNWSHAFGLCHVLPSGLYSFHVIPIENGVAHVWGEAIDGNKAEENAA